MRLTVYALTALLCLSGGVHQAVAQEQTDSVATRQITATVTRFEIDRIQAPLVEALVRSRSAASVSQGIHGFTEASQAEFLDGIAALSSSHHVLGEVGGLIPKGGRLTMQGHARTSGDGTNTSVSAEVLDIRDGVTLTNVKAHRGDGSDGFSVIVESRDGLVGSLPVGVDDPASPRVLYDVVSVRVEGRT